jgi:hypothetical protein
MVMAIFPGRIEIMPANAMPPKEQLLDKRSEVATTGVFAAFWAKLRYDGKGYSLRSTERDGSLLLRWMTKVITRRYRTPLFPLVLGFGFLQLPCSAQEPCKAPLKKTNVTVICENGQKITRLQIDLQNAPNNMEPVAEPRQIRVDNRANVRFLLRNLSPLDVCTRTPSAPTPTAETNVAESLVTTIAQLGGLSIGTSTARLPANAAMSVSLSTEAQSQLVTLRSNPRVPGCSVQDDPEYQRILSVAHEFFGAARTLIGSPTPDGSCRNDRADQVELACEIDSATRRLANYAGADYRGALQQSFQVDGNPLLQAVRDAYTLPLNSIGEAGRIQAMVDEIATWAGDLHKKYDYTVSSSDSSSPASPPIVPGALTVSPTTLSFSPATLVQPVQLAAGGQSGTFTATPSSDTGWLLLSKAGPTAPSTGTLTDIAPARGTFNLLVTANPVGLGATTHYGSITITGTGAATGTTIVNVTFKPVPPPPACDLESLLKVDEIVDKAKAMMSLLSDNNKSLEAAQASLKTGYMALVKVADDFVRRKNQNIVRVDNGVLIQQIDLGADRKDTATGYIACVSDIDGKTPTTINIYYSLLYHLNYAHA